jgi:hypothetical protein
MKKGTTMNRQHVKFLAPGKPPQFFEFAPNMKASDVIALGGGSDAVGQGDTISVGGKKGDGGTMLRPGDSVQIAPRAEHG